MRWIALVLLVGCAGAKNKTPLGDGSPPLVHPKLAKCTVQLGTDEATAWTYDKQGFVEGVETFSEGERLDALSYVWKENKVEISESFVGDDHTYSHSETIQLNEQSKVTKQTWDISWEQGDFGWGGMGEIVWTLDGEGLPTKATEDLNLSGELVVSTWSWSEVDGGRLAAVEREGTLIQERLYDERLRLIEVVHFADGEADRTVSYEYDEKHPERIRRQTEVGQQFLSPSYEWDCG